MKKFRIIIVLAICIICFSVVALIFYNDNAEVRSVKSEKELLKIYNGDESEVKSIAAYIFSMPFSFFYTAISDIDFVDIVMPYRYDKYNVVYEDMVTTQQTTGAINNASVLTKDYSTTNIQVENVDEADITKTDGDYIYSISDNNVIITNVINPEDIKIEATIKSSDGSIPEDLILYKDKLIIISTTANNINSYSYYYNNKSNTVVKVYNITSKSSPVLVKNYELYEPYYTSRCIGNKLYVIASGYLRKEDNKIVRSYKEDGAEEEIAFENIKYLKDVKTKKQTIISLVDLNDMNKKVDINSYLIDISNAYVSENSIYLLDQKYDYKNEVPSISKLYGPLGILGLFIDNEDYDFKVKNMTEIYKFDISKNGKVEYKAKSKIDGKTINQYSLDEKNNHLRVALYDNNGARIAIFDENLNQIGISSFVAKGEIMYSSRFMGDKAYLVTYRTMDPLFVIDLSNEKKPRVLGELHIPGYSTYLHPYDENHLIGIGMETEEITRKDANGKVLSTTASIIGMKMALFDVTDVNNPIQISQTVIGDRRTSSAILTNPKALLFSKEKELIAIPVNNYSEDFEISSSEETYSSMITSYRDYNKSRIAEGYFVYNINLKDGFKLKGIITHDISKKINYYSSKLLRGLYIDNNLYTVSEAAVKVNRLDTLELIDEMKIE